ncbi:MULTISPECIES: NADH-ubiquinone oxidoreductase-F iron-sulfur binding region domain-containing protein [Halorussus]|uniref:NADH-ubiquinone oxidoreductase-F iron-sulfur binding region domain-containing protein n=1 Tax=Halorussus TaxID=1070314 RepID=UPI00209E4C57|nr:NADH-ubiquinone oxidoreductase-F iron-sulfur binding region domain-containing protein [Halorussus vallis]USZ77029.1 NADH dehydrogenase FAD-containing subunit [Halorussus vallis]
MFRGNSEGDSTVVRVTVGPDEPPSDGSRSNDASADGEPPRRERGRRTLQAARTTAEEAAVLEVGSTGVRALEPLVLVTQEGRTAYHPRASPERARTLVERAESGDVGDEDATWVVDHDPDAETLPTPPDGPLAVGTRRVLGRCGWVDPESEVAADAAAASLAREDPTAALEQLETVGLLGRGRGDASQDAAVADGLTTVRETPGDPVVVVNANESDRRNETDRTLLGGAPAAVLDGALAVAAVVGAKPSDVVVYTNEVDDLARRRTRRAAAAVTDAFGERGDDEATVGGDDPPQVVAGPDEYIAGEFTMALEALEGNDRLEARLRPPGPGRHGLYGRPTVVHTPRTFAQVRRALLDPDAFDPADADPGTRVFTVAGDVETPATVELPTGGSLAAVRDAVDAAGRVKMACVGGQFGGFTRSLDRGVSAPALTGADLGTEGAVELLGEDRCAVATVGERARFASEENCGRCFPCREGSKQVLDLLRGVYDGDYDDDMIRELARTMRSSSICHFGQSAARSVGTALDRFETEFEAHADGRCPTGACEVSEP